MMAIRRAKKTLKKTVKKTAGKARKKAAKPAKKAAQNAKKVEGKWAKFIAQKDELIKKLKGQLTDRKGVLQEGEKTVREAMGKAQEEISAIREKTNQTLMEWKGKAEAEYKRLKEELEKKGQEWGGKVKDLEEYKKMAEKKIADLQARAKEYVTRAAPGPEERRGLVTFKGGAMTLLGPEIKVGDKAPDFKVADNNLQAATLDSFRGKIKILTSVPSLDTPVCDMETRRLNEEAGKMPDNVVVLTVSMDLPFAQKRWCAAAGVEKVKTLSDYQGRSFGLAYGVLVKELQLLGRAVFIVDDQDIVRYVEMVPEITKEPDYDRVLGAVKALL
jgi:thioredoxin-dependent peroxiredoxin